MKRLIYLVLLLTLVAFMPAVLAYELLGFSWQRNTTPYHVHIPGNPVWSNAFVTAINRWNSVSNFRITPVHGVLLDPCRIDHKNSVAMTADVCGFAYGQNVLAVTVPVLKQGGHFFDDADIFFNTRFPWRVYSGPLSNGIWDFRRIAVHELGHVLGLGHSSVPNSIMNVFNNTSESPKADDFRGVAALYGHMPARRIIRANLDAAGGDELVVDFGPGHGIWIYQNGSWRRLHIRPTRGLVTADMDNSGIDEIVVNFGPAAGLGLWVWENDTAWKRLHPRAPRSMVRADLDGSPEDELVSGFDALLGTRIRRNNSFWWKLHQLAPEAMESADLDNNGQDDLAMDFGSRHGLWIWMNDSFWVKRLRNSPQLMVAADLDNSGEQDLVVDRGPAAGLWVWKNNLQWTRLHTVSPRSMVAGDLDNNGRGDVVIDFGGRIGLWAWMNDSTWKRLHKGSPTAMATADINNNGADDVVASFGTNGMRVYLDNNAWSVFRLPLH